jgi:iron complex outermembrane receptor protein
LGNRDFHAEQLLAYELGYRWQVAPSVALDLASFYNHYTGLESLEVGTPFVNNATGQTIIPVIDRNLTDGRSGGVEALVTYSPLTYWRLSLTYSYIDMSLDAHGLDLNRGRFEEGSTPRNQAGVRSYLDLPFGLELDVQFRALSRLRSLPSIVTGEGLDGYEELDVRLGWQLNPRTRLSLDGQNLLHGNHIEFGAPGQRSAIRRSVYGKVSWEF